SPCEVPALSAGIGIRWRGLRLSGGSMKRLRRSEHREVETMLRELRPRPPAAFLMASADEVRVQQRRRGARRTALAVALSAAMLAAFGALGGIGYASSAVKHAVHVAN